jgi:hypothetical protein
MPHPRVPAAVVAAALAVLGAAPALADEILLANGRKLEGKAEKVGDEVVVRAAGGEIRLPAKEVAKITPGPTRDDLYRERLAKTDAKDPAALVALADWCRDQGLRDRERQHLRAVLELDPDHAAVRARLGYLRDGDRWVTDDEYHAARGFVKVGREWVSRDEIARRDAAKQAKAAMERHVRTIQACVAKMSSPLRKVRADGRVALQRYAEEISDPSLAEFATKVATFYNEQWRAVKAEIEGAGTATVEVRATNATLKRPIPTIETSLGAFSTPVRIQLPEMSVVSVRTTVRVPLTIELDE